MNFLGHPWGSSMSFTSKHMCCCGVRVTLALTLMTHVFWRSKWFLAGDNFLKKVLAFGFGCGSLQKERFVIKWAA